MAEQRYQVCRSRMTAARFRQSPRDPWGVANQRHWVRAVAFATEPCRARTSRAAAIGLVAPPPALTLLIRETRRPGGRKAKRKRDGWDGDCLPKILAG